jgi:LIVCS family branched-chain amino acid:cation transporter
MKKYLPTLIYGFTVFKMFFGSGNLVFPLQIGLTSGNHWFIAFVGLFITGIILPFLGLFVIKLHHGRYEEFFGEAGKVASIILPLFTLSLLGAFGIVPRCITVAFGGIHSIFPQLPLILFSTIFCSICFILCLKDHVVVSALGKWMGPILLICLTILIGIGIYHAPSSYTELSALHTFQDGFIHGYQTMDLFAAYFFSSFIFIQIQKSMPNETNPNNLLRAAIKPSLIGATLLALIYLGFVFLGAHYQTIAAKVSPELILPTIAIHLFGKYATFLISVILIFSCLATAVALNNIYARYLCNLFKLPPHYFSKILLLTTTVSFLISLLDFRGIAAFLAPVLDISYPGLIALTILSIFIKGRKQLKMWVFYGMVLMMLGYTI